MNGFDELFNQEFQDFSQEPSSQVWGKLDHKLKVRRRRRTSVFIGVCLFFVSLFSYNVFEYLRLPDLPIVKAIWEEPAVVSAQTLKQILGQKSHHAVGIQNPIANQSVAPVQFVSNVGYEVVPVVLNTSVLSVIQPELQHPHIENTSVSTYMVDYEPNLNITKEKPGKKPLSPWSVELSGGFANQSVSQIAPNQSTYSLILNNSETPLPSNHFQVRVSRKLAHGLQVSAGLGYHESRIKQSYNFTQWVNESNKVRFYDEVSNSYFEVNYENRKMLASSYSGVHSTKWLTIPIQITWQSKGKVKLYGGTGIQANVLLSEQGKVLTMSSSPNLVDSKSNSNVNPFQLQGRILAGLNLPISQHVSFNVEPFVSKTITNEFKSDLMHQSSSSIGLNLGVKYQF